MIKEDECCFMATVVTSRTANTLCCVRAVMKTGRIACTAYCRHLKVEIRQCALNVER